VGRGRDQIPSPPTKPGFIEPPMFADQLALRIMRLSLPSAIRATDLGDCMHRRVGAKANAPEAATFLNPAALAKSELLQIPRSRKSALSWWSITTDR
jgi:hypothetical protein